MHKMSALVKLRAIINELFKKYTTKPYENMMDSTTAQSGYG